MTIIHQIKRYSSLAKHLGLIASLVAVTSVHAEGSQQVEKRELISKETPTYPKKAVREKLSGYVVMSFAIDKYGTPVDISVEQSQPEGVFDKSAVKALEQWQYSRSKSESEARYEVRLDFKLEQ